MRKIRRRVLTEERIGKASKASKWRWKILFRIRTIVSE